MTSYLPNHLSNTAPNPDTLFSVVTKINGELDAIAATFANLGETIGYNYRKTALTGGGSTALDGIDGAELDGGEVGFVVVGDNPATLYIYVLDPDDGRAQALPYIVAPVTNAGQKRWILSSRVDRLWSSGAAPTANDDITIGAQPGDSWKSGNDLWKCADNTAGAAVWIKLLKTGTEAGTACEGNDSRILAAETHRQAAAPHTGHATTAAVNAAALAASAAQASADDAQIAADNAQTTANSAQAAANAAIPSTEKGAENGVATLNSSQKALQDPANATATPTANKIPIADTLGRLDAWVDHDVVHGRINYVSATQLAWMFLQSNQITLHDGTDWKLVQASSAPTIGNTDLDVNGDALAVDTIYDVFGYHSSSTGWAFKLAKWANSAAGTSARCTAWSGSSVAYTIGMRVSNGSPAHYYSCIHAHTSAAATEPGVGSNWTNEWVDCGTDPGDDFRGLYQLNGRWTFGPNATGANAFDGRKYRWLGVVYTYNNGGTVNFKDYYVSNFRNARPVSIEACCLDSDYSLSSTSFRELNGGVNVQRANFVLCCAQSIRVNLFGSAYGTTANTIFTPALDSTSSSTANRETYIATTQENGGCGAIFSVSKGVHYVTILEKGDAAPRTVRTKKYTHASFSLLL